MEKGKGAHQGKMDTTFSHGCHSVPSQNHAVVRLPKPDPAAIYQMGTLRDKEGKQLLQGHTASNTQTTNGTQSHDATPVSPHCRVQVSGARKTLFGMTPELTLHWT